MRFRLFALLILPTLALAALATVVVVDRNTNHGRARTALDVAELAGTVARVDQALGDEALHAAHLVGPRAESGWTTDDEASFLKAVATTDTELGTLQQLLETRPYHDDLTSATTAVRTTLQYRSDVTNSTVSPLQVNDRYAHVRDLLLDALSTQATVMEDAAGQQRIVALIALIESRGAHLDERLVVELALAYHQWAPGQHSAAIASVARQDDRIQFANSYFDRAPLTPPLTLNVWREQIITSNDIPSLTVEEWGAISDGWLSALRFHIETDQRRIAESLAEAEQSAANQRSATLFGVIAVVLLAAGLTAAVAYRLVKRVGIITEQAQHMAFGSTAVHTFPQVRGNDELGHLARSFDEMISQVDQRANNQLIESTALEAIANRAPLDETLACIAALLGVDEDDEPLYRFDFDAAGAGGAEEGRDDQLSVSVMRVDGADLDESILDTAEARTALGLVATAYQSDVDHNRLDWQANHDELTGLLNRSAIIEHVSMTVAEEVGGDNTNEAPVNRTGLVYADLDGFKAINDKFGHTVGDAVLLEQSQRLAALADDIAGVAGRFGGDEFVMVVPGVTSRDDLDNIVKTLMSTLRQPIHSSSTDFEVGVSVGASLSRRNSTTVQMLNEADSALQEAKQVGPGVAVISTQQLRDKTLQAEQLRSEVLDAFDKGEFSAWYQPVWGAAGAELVGLEALVRWHHPERGTVSPAVFLPVVQDLRLLPKLDAILFDQVCRQTVHWLDAGFALDQVHVNISTERLEVAEFVLDTERTLAATGCPPSVMVAEVTETGLMTDTRSNSHRLQALRELGIRIAVDDFGQGYSSLAYLSELPIDLVKLDRRFVDRIDEQRSNQAIVSAVIDLSHRLGLTIVAEGLERAEELDYLTRAGSELFQGFLLGRPMPARETTALLGRLRPPALDIPYQDLNMDNSQSAPGSGGDARGEL